MDLLMHFVNFFVHLDTHLGGLITHYGVWTYAILFIIIFGETGLVVTPFLPGDSLIFAAGAFAATGCLSPWLLFILLSIAAITGNISNYWIGYLVGPGILIKNKIPFIKKSYLDRTHQFYEKHGGKAIVFARFIPIIRTFAPFVAGVGYMSYRRFMIYNVTAGIAWVGMFIALGFFFGNLPAVKHNFTFVIFGIIGLSILPAIIEFLRHKKNMD